MVSSTCHFEEKIAFSSENSVKSAVEIRKLACYITHRTKKRLATVTHLTKPLVEGC